MEIIFDNHRYEKLLVNHVESQYTRLCFETEKAIGLMQGTWTPAPATDENPFVEDLDHWMWIIHGTMNRIESFIDFVDNYHDIFSAWCYDTMQEFERKVIETHNAYIKQLDYYRGNPVYEYQKGDFVFYSNPNHYVVDFTCPHCQLDTYLNVYETGESTCVSCGDTSDPPMTYRQAHEQANEHHYYLINYESPSIYDVTSKLEVDDLMMDGSSNFLTYQQYVDIKQNGFDEMGEFNSEFSESGDKIEFFRSLTSAAYEQDYLVIEKSANHFVLTKNGVEQPIEVTFTEEGKTLLHVNNLRLVVSSKDKLRSALHLAFDNIDATPHGRR